MNQGFNIKKKIRLFVPQAILLASTISQEQCKTHKIVSQEFHRVRSVFAHEFGVVNISNWQHSTIKLYCDAIKFYCSVLPVPLMLAQRISCTEPQRTRGSTGNYDFLKFKFYLVMWARTMTWWLKMVFNFYLILEPEFMFRTLPL